MINDSDSICIKGTFSILNYEAAGTQYTTFSSTDNGGGNYNKCYYHIRSNASVTTGEIWNTTTEYDWNVGIPHESEEES